MCPPIGCAHEAAKGVGAPAGSDTEEDIGVAAAMPGRSVEHDGHVEPEGSLMENRHSSGVLDQIPRSNARRSQQGYNWV